MSGFVCNVNERRAKDWRFIKAMADWDSGDESRALKGVTTAVPLLLYNEATSLRFNILLSIRTQNTSPCPTMFTKTGKKTPPAVCRL